MNPVWSLMPVASPAPSRLPGGSPRDLLALEESIPFCARCPELRTYGAEIAATKRRAYLDWDYWGRPVPGFGDRRARILIVGLAPAAHGANRTGRMFTGDRSGDFLYAALHRAGLANQPAAEHRNDGLELRDVYITAALRCAPPGNRPTAAQLRQCSGFLIREIEILQPRVILCLGSIAWNAVLRIQPPGHIPRRPKPKFAHGAECLIGDRHLLACFHVSQQNTFTGRLTEPMLDAILARAVVLARG